MARREPAVGAGAAPAPAVASAGEATRSPASPQPAGLQALRCAGDALEALDQTALPSQETLLALKSAEEVAEAIRRLSIRGAPLIGVAAAYGVALAVARNPGRDALERACEALRSARPTAVNLARAVNRVRSRALAAQPGTEAAAARAEAAAIEAEELAASARIATHGADLLMSCRRVLTHCNTGALAAPGRGTALAVVAELFDRGGFDGVIATESRPLLQGARLTAYELGKLGIPHELIVDSAAAGLIASGAVDGVIVGCDRVAMNGDVANKVGTYGLALAARAAKIPFVVAGPTSTIDPDCTSGREITIEQRSPDEVMTVSGMALAPPGTRCRNPAFDVTPADLLTALVTERGVASPVGERTVAALLTLRARQQPPRRAVASARDAVRRATSTPRARLAVSEPGRCAPPAAGSAHQAGPAGRGAEET